MSERELQAVACFALATTDLGRLAQFYCDVLGFTPHGPAMALDDGEMALLGLSGAGRRQVLLLGEQMVWIDQFEQAGQPYPVDGDAAALWFQHLALVVGDMRDAYDRLRNVIPISHGGPQLLPISSGGVRAFKFRDPDGHPLELLEFPSGQMSDAWRHRCRPDGQPALGIDHSAISVTDTQASALFYETLGLSVGKRTRNQGRAQQGLDGLPGAEVEVVPMIPCAGTPHLELLGYRTPQGQAGPVLRANDVAATRIVWHGREARLISDPDRHLQQVLQSYRP